MRLGVCYYPEHWPEERWATDAAQMRELGLEIVRMGEFAWAKMEPQEGHFEFGWLDRAIDVMAGAGLRVVLGTPTVCPPAWMVRADPGILPVDAEGRRRNFGGRRHYCPNNARYRAHAARIVTALAERYGRDERVIGWQIDNEFGGGSTGRCYCDTCAAAFRDWLRARYSSLDGLDGLNEAWATVFWSQTYTAWDQIGPPILQLNQPNPSHALDYRRFSSDSIASFAREQVAILRAHAPGQWTTTNLMGLFSDLDHFDLAAGFDFVTWDSYPTGNLERWEAACYGDELKPAGGRPYAYDVGDPYVTGFAHELTRGLLARPFWVMEQQAGQINWGRVNPSPRDLTVRLWTWHDLAAGADVCMYFRWRACLFAQEQYHSGLLHHDASPDLGHREVASLAADRAALARLAAAPARPRVALLFSYDDLWALELQPHRAGFSYLRLAFAWYRALARLGIAVDIVPASERQRRATGQRPLTDYAALIAPTLHVVDPAEASILSAWVEAGGHLLFGVRSGFKTPSNRVTPAPLPGVLRGLAGAAVTDWHALPTGVSYSLDWMGVPGLDAGSAGIWAEALEPDDGTDVLARYSGGPFAGSAAVTEHVCGSGAVTYVGVHPTLEVCAALASRVAAPASVERLTPEGRLLPDGLLAIRRGAEAIVLNFTDGRLAATVGGMRVEVGPRSVAVVSLD
jgi:beta-galactosidase